MTEEPPKKNDWSVAAMKAVGIATALILIGGYFWTFAHAAFHGERPDWPDEFSILAITGVLALLGISRMAPRK